MATKNYSLAIFTAVMAPLASSIPSTYAISQDKIIEQQEEVRAFATWVEGDPATDETCLVTSLSIQKINDENFVVTLRVATIVMDCSEESDALTGGISTTEEIFTIDKQLKRASLPPVEIDLCDEDVVECTVPKETVTVQAEWTGVGDIQETKNRSVFVGSDNVKVIEITEFNRRDAAKNPENLIMLPLTNLKELSGRSDNNQIDRIVP
jgi:uncharacterized protein (UPF0212 family)